MPLYANTFLGWKDKKVRENITVNNKNITLNGKKYHRKNHSNAEMYINRVKPDNDREVSPLMTSWLCCVRDGKGANELGGAK